MPGKFRGKAGDGVEKYDGAGRLYPRGVRLKKIRSILLSPPGRRCGNLVFAVLVLAVFWYARNLRNAEIAAPAPETSPNILSTSPKYDRIVGFGGPVPARIVLDSASGKIDRIEFPPNAEDPEYWRQVLASGVFDRYRNLTPAEAAALPIDVVTGATFSSRAAQETIRERLAEAAALPPAGSSFQSLEPDRCGGDSAAARQSLLVFPAAARPLPADSVDGQSVSARFPGAWRAVAGPGCGVGPELAALDPFGSAAAVFGGDSAGAGAREKFLLFRRLSVRLCAGTDREARSCRRCAAAAGVVPVRSPPAPDCARSDCSCIGLRYPVSAL